MFAPLCRRLFCLALGACISAPSFAAPTGSFASEQARHIATYFPGRMTGTPAEMLTADYLRQQFAAMGYESDIRTFNSRYIYTDRNHRQSWRKVTGSTVIAAREGSDPQQIVVMAHLDTYAPLSDEDSAHNLGGLTLQGIDDNALGVGVMLELAEKLRDVPIRYGIRFIATSGEEQGRLGAKNLLERMTPEQRKNTLLVINLDNLAVGDRLYFNSGKNTPEAVRKLTRDRALTLAHRWGVPAASNPGLNAAYPKGTACCSDADVFDSAGIPVLSVEATNWSLGKKDGYQQRAKSRTFPEGTSWHDPRLDNQQYLDRALPGRIDLRGREVVNVMLPLVRELAGTAKGANGNKKVGK
ncbi:aminopeptidase [Pluralibacter gergoviae]|uniref:aminopeptidase n=1 Tax=Pluralibacter gergoviae TaxID=61647 RepID=UPI0004F5E713|nr:aminopeptidase [Pluralibacter gergoviae]AIR00110.1 Zn-dependent exopeptidase M28 [Pluralibacter gergoviae]